MKKYAQNTQKNVIKKGESLRREIKIYHCLPELDVDSPSFLHNVHEIMETEASCVLQYTLA